MQDRPFDSENNLSGLLNANTIQDLLDVFEQWNTYIRNKNIRDLDASKMAGDLQDLIKPDLDKLSQADKHKVFIRWYIADSFLEKKYNNLNTALEENEKLQNNEIRREKLQYLKEEKRKVQYLRGISREVGATFSIPIMLVSEDADELDEIYKILKERYEETLNNQFKKVNPSSANLSEFKSNLIGIQFYYQAIDKLMEIGNAYKGEAIRYIIGDDKRNGPVKTRDGKMVPSLAKLINDIDNTKNITDKIKIELLEQAVLTTYRQLRQHYGWQDNPLADSLQDFLESHENLALPFKYAQVIPLSLDSNDVITEFFNTKKTSLAMYMKNNNIRFNDKDIIQANTSDLKEQARIRIILSDLAQTNNQFAKIFNPLLKPLQMMLDEQNFPFTVAYQQLKIKLNLHLKTDRIADINDLMNELEEIRNNNNFPSEYEKLALMKEVIVAKHQKVSQEAQQSKWISTQSNLADALNEVSKTIQNQLALYPDKPIGKEIDSIKEENNLSNEKELSYSEESDKEESDKEEKQEEVFDSEKSDNEKQEELSNSEESLEQNKKKIIPISNSGSTHAFIGKSMNQKPLPTLSTEQVLQNLLLTITTLNSTLDKLNQSISDIDNSLAKLVDNKKEVPKSQFTFK